MNGIVDGATDNGCGRRRRPMPERALVVLRARVATGYYHRPDVVDATARAILADQPALVSALHRG